MTTLDELFRQGKNEELWQRCCGFIDLSLKEFMNIQSRLLKEQLTLLKKCELGRNILKGANPENITEFRELVPLTTYADYAPYLLKRKMDVLPRKPIMWQYTSGKYGEYTHRWAPVTSRANGRNRTANNGFSALFLLQKKRRYQLSDCMTKYFMEWRRPHMQRGQ